MGRLQEFVERQKADFVKILRKYKVTILLVIVACIYRAFLEEIPIILYQNIRYMDNYSSKVYTFLLMSAAGSFAAETFQCRKTEEEGKGRRVSIGIAYGLSLFFGGIWTVLAIVVTRSENKFLEYYVSAAAILYILVLLGFSLVRIIRESGLRFEQYAVRLLFTMVKVCAVLLTLNIGVLLLLVLFDSLIIGIDYWGFMEDFEILLVGFLYVPYVLICITGKMEERSKFVRGLILFCMMPLVMAAMVIIYLYIGKILITRKFPSNEVFTACAALFCTGVCVWTFAYAYTREGPRNLYYLLIKYMKYIYAPFLLLEIYCLGVRIGDYGLTQERYLGVWFIVAQVIYTAWEPLVNLMRRFWKKEKIGYGEHYEWLIYVGIAIFVLLAFVPATQVEKVVFRSQKARFLKDYTGEEASLEKAQGAFRELDDNLYGTVWLEENYEIGQLREAMESLGNYAKDYRDYVYVSQGSKNDMGGISVTGFDMMYRLHEWAYQYDDPITREEYSSYKIKYEGGTVTVDLSGLVDECVEAERMHREWEVCPYIIDADTVRIVLYAVELTYDRTEDALMRMELDGAILEKLSGANQASGI